ncbi:hypothetical protein Ancab_030520, partial [Ancistrocladus abbreviatus]
FFFCSSMEDPSFRDALKRGHIVPSPINRIDPPSESIPINNLNAIHKDSQELAETSLIGKIF